MSREWKKSRPAKGYTLLEIIAAGAITALVLVPTLKLLRNCAELSERVEVANLLTTLCVSKVEQHSALVAADFTTDTETGHFAAQGFPELAFQVIRSDHPDQGGVAEQLMAIIATVWHDANNNGLRDDGEASATFSTKLANLAVYREQTDGS